MLHRPAPHAPPHALTHAGHTLDVLDLTVRYGATLALDAVSLELRAGEVLALLGPSGCGKTTLLRSVAGFVRPTAGQVLIDGAVIDDLPPERRQVGIVFQNYALFPHMTVADNIAYGLRAQGTARAAAAARTTALLDMVQMRGFGARRPAQLSGGQQQRVALARALATGPRILLLDEPFAALDRSLRFDMQIEVRRLQRDLGLTAILVTHDQDEAMSVADRIAVMRGGRIEQLGTPVDVYDRPRTLFVAGFIGSMNRIACTVAGVAEGMARLRLADGTPLLVPVDGALPPGPALLAVRPESLALHDAPAEHRFPVTPRLAVPLGGQVVREAVLPDGTAVRITEPRQGLVRDAGATAWCGLVPGARAALFARTDTEED